MTQESSDLDSDRRKKHKTLTSESLNGVCLMETLTPVSSTSSTSELGAVRLDSHCTVGSLQESYTQSCYHVSIDDDDAFTWINVQRQIYAPVVTKVDLHCIGTAQTIAELRK